MIVRHFYYHLLCILVKMARQSFLRCTVLRFIQQRVINTSIGASLPGRTYPLQTMKKTTHYADNKHKQRLEWQKAANIWFQKNVSNTPRHDVHGLGSTHFLSKKK